MVFQFIHDLCVYIDSDLVEFQCKQLIIQNNNLIYLIDIKVIRLITEILMSLK